MTVGQLSEVFPDSLFRIYRHGCSEDSGDMPIYSDGDFCQDEFIKWDELESCEVEVGSAYSDKLGTQWMAVTLKKGEWE